MLQPTGLPLDPDTSRHKFLMLDALRGIAALVVVQHHTPELFGRKFFPRGYLAVDFFFLLSGFVLTFAYQHRLDRGWPAASFFKARIARLYPMYFLGLPLGLLALFLSRHHAHAPTPAATALSLLLGLFLIPFLPGLPFTVKAAYPLNFPTWSLFGETVANILHGLFLGRLTRRALLSVIGACLLCLLLCIALAHTIDFGVGRVGVLLSIPRVLFSYCLGILLFRFSTAHSPSFRVPPWLPSWLTCLLLPLALALPHLARLDPIADLLIVALAFPFILLLGLDPAPAGLSPLLRLLGTLSYPVYILHAPLVGIFAALVPAITSRPVTAYAPWSGLVFLLLAGALSLFAERFYDIPARQALRRALAR